MENPFKFSGIVEAPAFCDREQELSDLKQYAESSQNVLLYSHRRYGKSSLLFKLMRDLKSIQSIYVDLYGTTSPQDFLAAFLTAICSLESKIERLMKLIRNSLSSISINFGIDPLTGLPTVSPILGRKVDDRTMSELFTLLEHVSKKRKLLVVFDEFQEVAAYEEASFEKQLRKSIQTHDTIAYFFAGSQRHLLMDMFNDNKRAFYQLAASYPLKKIETGHYVEWANGLFQAAGKRVDLQTIEAVVTRCHNHPRYVQQFFHELWHVEEVNPTIVEQTERQIITKRVPEFAYIWDSLSLNQKRALKLLAGTEGKNIFAADKLSRFGFRTASQVTAALITCEKLGIASKNKSWSIQDPFFEKWLQLKISGIHQLYTS